MKKLIFLMFTLAVVLPATAQHYEYIKIYTAQAGMEDKDKAKFVFPDNPDSAKVYSNFKLADILLAVEMMERKGFELVTISIATNSVGLGAVIFTTAIMRREKPKKVLKPGP